MPIDVGQNKAVSLDLYAVGDNDVLWSVNLTAGACTATRGYVEDGGEGEFMKSTVGSLRERDMTEPWVTILNQAPGPQQKRPGTGESTSIVLSMNVTSLILQKAQLEKSVSGGKGQATVTSRNIYGCLDVSIEEMTPTGQVDPKAETFVVRVPVKLVVQVRARGGGVALCPVPCALCLVPCAFLKGGVSTHDIYSNRA